MTKEIIHYSEEELKGLSDFELLSKVHNLNIRLVNLNPYLIHHNQELLHEIIQRTEFLDIDYKNNRTGESIPLTARLYCLSNGLTSTPRCSKKDCNRPVGWNASKGVFREYCSGGCRSSDDSFKNKIRITNQSPQHIEKMISVNRQKSELMKSKEMRERIKNSCQMNLGVDHPMKSKLVIEHRKRVWQKNLGCDNPMRSNRVMQKRIDDFKAKHGVGNPAQLDDIRRKISETHKSNECKSKINATCEKRYGTKWYQQSQKYHKNKRHKYKSEKYPELTFDSKWEVKVYEFCRDTDIPIEYSPSISYEYEYDGKVHTYHPDFLINGKVYEVKGDHFFRINESTGLEEMFNPYRESYWSDERYEWECGKFEAKHQCMIANGVVILRDDNIKHITFELFHQ